MERPEAQRPSPVGRAVSFAVTEFGTPGGDEPAADRVEEQPTSDFPSLVQFGGYCHELMQALGWIGYETEVVSNPAAERIGSGVRSVTSQGVCGPARIVHVLSHGELSGSDSLLVLGSDRRADATTRVENWLRDVQDFPERFAHTLFLLDLCYAGKAALAPWLHEVLDGKTRAWVIAACGPYHPAYDARLTRATAKVLGELAAGRLDIYVR
jgi:hypothetical protein